MAIVSISRIQHRRGLRIDLPNPLQDAEFGWAQDERELFIGNGPFFGGNTQILTELTPASLPDYTYISNTDTVANTGFEVIGDPSIPIGDNPTIRDYQQKFDDIVSVKDYGAVGDFDTDDTGALFRALRDVYEGLGEDPTDDSRRRRAIFFPAGTYRISQALPLYPFCTLIGEGKGQTTILLDFTLTTTGMPVITGNSCVARTVDSRGDSAFNIGTGIGSIVLPQNITVSGITFESDTPQTEASGNLVIDGGVKEIIKLDQVKNVRFDNCEFAGTWTLTDPNVFQGSVGVFISRVSNTSAEMKNYTFRGCTFRNTVHAFNVLDTISDVYIVDGEFKDLHHPIQLAQNPVFNILPGTSIDANPAAPELFRVTHSHFSDYENNAFDVRSKGRGNISSYNFYSATGSTPAVRFDGPAVTDSCVSIGDTFEETGSFSCANRTSNLRVQNHSDLNIVMNAQDQFQIPSGFCGDITIDGNVTINGDLTLTGAFINTSAPILPSGGIITSIPYTSGNIIHFEYGMNNPPGVYRTGTMKITHDSVAAGPITNLSFDDSFTEAGGPPANPITLSAVANNGFSRVDIVVTTIEVPTYNFTIRTMTV